MKQLTFLFCFFLALFVQPVYAQTGSSCLSPDCMSPPSTIGLDTTVVNPTTGIAVHTLGPNDPLFGSNDSITLGITLTNTGSTTIANTTIVDAMPQYVRFVSAPGTFDKVADTVTFTSGTLAPNQSQSFTITGMLVSNVPGLQPNCVVNTATATTIDHRTAQDSSNFCVGSNVSPSPEISTQSQPPTAPPTITPTTPQLPATGASALILLVAIPLGIGGILLQRAAKKDT